MRFTVRHGFETNSSSMHSIVVTKDNGKSRPSIYNFLHEHYRIYTSDIQFGRSPFNVLYTVLDKGRYAIAAAGSDSEKVDEIVNLLQEITGIEKIDVEKVKKEKYRIAGTDTEKYWFEIDFDDDPTDPTMEIPYLKTEKDLPLEQRTQIEYLEYEEYDGLIDHQSSGLLESFLVKEGITLREFLTEKKYVVVIDGDEYDVFGSLHEAGLVNTDNIHKIC